MMRVRRHWLSLLALLLCGWLTARPAAAQTWPPTPPPTTAPVVLGLSLAGVPVNSRYQNLPDVIVEPDPVQPRGEPRGMVLVRVPPNVISLKLTPEAALSYVPSASHFYITYRMPGGGPAIIWYYGPFDGDPFDRLKLETWLFDRMNRDHDPRPRETFEDRDVYDIKELFNSMFTFKDVDVVMHALDIADSAVNAIEPSRLWPYMTPLAESLQTNDASLRQLGFGEFVDSLNKKLATVETRIDAGALEVAADQYSKGSIVDPATKIPDTAWGEPVNGLRAALIGERIISQNARNSFSVIVENTTDHEIHFSIRSDISEDLRPTVVAPDGRSNSWLPGRRMEMAPVLRYRIGAGERIVLTERNVVVADPQSTVSNLMNTVLTSGPGDYQLSYRILIGEDQRWERAENGLMRRTSPARGEWHGTRQTGMIKITVK